MLVPILTLLGPEVIKLFSCSTQLSMKIFRLINVKMPTIVGILTFMSGKNSILGLAEPKRSLLLLLLCSDSRNDVPPVPQRNVSIAAERGAVRPSTLKEAEFLDIFILMSI